ncbi:hypothetical protein ACWF76_27705 [Streptomyces globisporus]
MHLSRSPRRRAAAWAAAAAITAAGLLIGPPPAAVGTGPSVRVDAALLDAVDGGGEASFFVVLKNRADLSAARGERAHAARTTSAFTELRAEADSSQRSLNSFLDRKKVGHQNFWIANAVKVTGDEDLVQELAGREDVARVVKEQHDRLDDVEARPAEEAAAAAEGGGRRRHWTRRWGRSAADARSAEPLPRAGRERRSDAQRPEAVPDFSGTASDLRLSPVGTTGFEPATP